MNDERSLKLFTIFVSLMIITTTFLIAIQELFYYFNN